MNAARDLTDYTPHLDRLAVFLQDSGSELSEEQAIEAAVNGWIAAQRRQEQAPAPDLPSRPPYQADVLLMPADAVMQSALPATPTDEQPTPGYLWKGLFLPQGTRLRMYYDSQPYAAQVVGDQIMYRGRSVSPRGLTLAIAGDGRNAWHDLHLLLPGETRWQRASVRRNAMRRANPAVPPTPADTMAAAAASMERALQTVLALVDRVKQHAIDQPERRITRRRRSSDMMEDWCAMD